VKQNGEYIQLEFGTEGHACARRHGSHHFPLQLISDDSEEINRHFPTEFLVDIDKLSYLLILPIPVFRLRRPCRNSQGYKRWVPEG